MRGILIVFACAAAAVAQMPAPAGRGGAGQASPPCPFTGPCDKQIIDPAAAERGRSLYAAECVQCHGALARGTDGGPNLVRSLVVLNDRVGTQLGPFLKKGHKTQSGVATTSFTDAQIASLSHFLKQRVEEILRVGNPAFRPNNILVGDAKAGEVYFNGDGKCSGCHSPTGDLKGIGGRMAPVALQQRFIFPGGRGGVAGPAPKQVTFTVTPATGPAITGVMVVLDDFYVSIRDASGEVHTWKRTPAMKIVKNDPYQGHWDLLERITDKAMHDVTAYLNTLK